MREKHTCLAHVHMGDTQGQMGSSPRQLLGKARWDMSLFGESKWVLGEVMGP